MGRIKADEQARRYFDFAGTLLVVLGPDEKTMSVNRKASEVLGCEEAGIIGLNWFDEFIVDEEREHARAIFNSLMIGDIEPVEYSENSIVTRGGEIRLIRWHNTVLRDEGDRITATIASGEDITGQRRAEKMLAESESRFRSFFESSPIGIELYDVDGRLLDINRACLDIFGVSSKDEVAGFGLFDDPNMPADVKGQVRKGEAASYKSVFDFEKIRELQLYETSRSGTAYIDVIIAPLRWGSEERKGYIVQVQDITGRVQAQEQLDDYSHRLEALVEARTAELAQSRDIIDAERKQLFSLLDGLPAFVYLQAEDYSIRYANNLFQQRFGELDSLKCYEHMWSRSEPCEICPTFEVFRTGLPKTWIWDESPDGRTYLIYDQLFQDVDGSRLVLETGIDISDQKQLEAELDGARTALTTILDSIEALVYVADMDTYEMIFMNRYGIENFGETDGKRCWEVFQQGQKGPCDFCTNDKLLDSRGGPAGVYNWEFQNTKNGRWYEIHDQAIRWTDGRLVRMEVAEDFTERKQAEDLIIESERKYRQVFNESKDGIFVASPGIGFTDINQSGLEILGYDPTEEFPSIDPEKQLHGLPDAMRSLQQELEHHGYVKNHELSLRKKDGSRVLVAVTASAQQDETGEITEYSGTFRDLTAQKEMEQKLLELQKMESIGRLTGGIAHSFNNLLTGVIGHIDLAALEGGLAGETAKELDSARSAALKAADLSLQLMRFGQREQVDLAPTDVNKIVEGVASLLSESIGNNYRIELELDPGVSSADADIRQLSQALVNLTLNARDAMPDGGVIEISTSSVEKTGTEDALHPEALPGVYACISITDHGEGIPDAVLPLIFEPFFSTRGVEAGSGLGLTVVYGIVRQHGGWIDVNSKVDEGSTFSVHIPATIPSLANDESEETAAGEARGSILIVEDEEVVRNMTLKMLVRSGYKVHAAATVDEARRRFESVHEEITVIFCDVVLPDGSGLKLVDELVQRKPGLKAMLASGYSDEVIEASDIRKRGYTFLQKPYSLDYVKKTIARLMAGA